MSRPALLALVVGMAACGPRNPGTPAPDGGSTGTAEVTLERGPCFGTCPVYRVSLSGDGTVEFVGTRFVSRVGTDTGRVTPSAVDSLVRALETAGYFAFADQYLPDTPACGRYASDAPTVTITVHRAAGDKAVRHDHGCADAPAELGRLEQLIDSVAGTARWTGR